MPLSIHDPQHTYFKRMLNNLVYIQQAMPGTQAGSAASETILYIQKALNSPHAGIKKIYQELAHNIYQEITTQQIINHEEILKNRPLSLSQSTVTDDTLLKKFFLPNGLIKEFSQWPEAQYITHENNFLSSQDVYAREFLNNTLYALHTTTDKQLRSILQGSLQNFAQKLNYAGFSSWHNEITWYTAIFL